MKDHNQHEIQMSEAFLNSAFLALSGGFQDAYTYNARNEVFCNAQTGNVVLMSQHFMAGEVTAGLGYFFPIIFFALGVWVAEKMNVSAVRWSLSESGGRLMIYVDRRCRRRLKPAAAASMFAILLRLRCFSAKLRRSSSMPQHILIDAF